ncbi:MAG: AAC(3) family N-acetyltransferase [Oligosphaeraceae bacterium]|nr:AAC(3) family N-acetyltransferase [Oligosphaeraceae bacterium]
MEEQAIREMMCKDLRRLGIREGDTILVHSSLRSLGPLPGGAETAVASLLEVLGEEGTLLFPALSYRSVNAENPCFDVRRTPCCVGALPEYFRTRPGTLRSIHPTHSVSGVGKKAAMLLKDHELDTTSCGPHSPFRRLREAGNWILFIGCGIAPNTSMHAVEELIDPPYLHGAPVDYRIILFDGSEMQMKVRRHNFVGSGYGQVYARMAYLLDFSQLRYGNVLSAFCALMSIPAMWEQGEEALRKDPFYFVRPL